MGTKGRGVIVATAATVVGIVFWPVASPAASTTATMPFDQDVQTCTGLTVHLSGQLLGVFTVSTNPAGGFMVASHVQPQGIQGVDPQTGIRYIGTGLTRDVQVVTPGGTSTFSFLNRFHIQATRGADGFDLTQLLHVTSLADGTVTAFVDRLSVSC